MKFQVQVTCKKCGRVVNAEWDGGRKLKVHRHANHKKGGWCKSYTTNGGFRNA